MRIVPSTFFAAFFAATYKTTCIAEYMLRTDYKYREQYDNICRDSVKICCLFIARLTRLVLLIITGGDFCKSKADVIIMIQDNLGISEGTRQSIHCVVRTLLTTLNNDETDFKFAMAIYATENQMNPFGTAESAIFFMNYKHRLGKRGSKNLLGYFLENDIPNKFNSRPANRKGTDTAKVFLRW